MDISLFFSLLSAFNSHFDQMLWFLMPNFFFFVAGPVVSFFFFCKYNSVTFKGQNCFLYVILAGCIYYAEFSLDFKGSLWLLPEILFLAVWGILPCSIHPDKVLASLTAAALILSVSSICQGISQLLFFWLSVKASLVFHKVFLFFDAARELTKVLLSLFLLNKIQKHLPPQINTLGQYTNLVLTIPMFYIMLVERTIRNFIYGDSITFDSHLGIVSPVIRHTEIFILQVFACLCLFLTLGAWKKIQKTHKTEQTIWLLRQQTQAQETYLEETRLRYQQTRSFRHDIRNHLSVLSQLLNANETDSARQYLSHLTETSDELSIWVQTGNAPVDALLGSKLSLASQAGITTECEMKIPAFLGVSDMDWCILLANGIDNAIKATCLLPPEERKLLIYGKQKGNFFLLTLENSCSPHLLQPPKEGIGLSNIRAVMKKYDGTTKIHLEQGTFRLSLFFVSNKRPFTPN